MLRAFCSTLTVLMLTAGPALAGDPPDKAANAALQYWQAFATLPRLTNAEETKIAQSLTGPLDEQARGIVGNAEYSLTCLHRGARLRRCDWGIPYEEGIYIRLPHVPAARALASLACLRARMHFEQGRSAEAVQDILDAMTLGRHISHNGNFLVVLVGYAIEHRAIDTLGGYLPRLEAKTVKRLKTRLDSLAPFGSLSTAMRTEEKWALDWFMNKVKEAKDRESLLAFLSFINVSEGKSDSSGAKARAFLQECGGTAEGVVKYVEEMRPSFAVAAKKLELAPEAFEKWESEEARNQAGNPAFKLIFPAVAKCRQAKARVDIRRALLSAALDVQLDGVDALKNHPDPVMGGSFEHVPFDGGFELRSRFKGQNGKALSVVVGRK